MSSNTVEPKEIEMPISGAATNAELNKRLSFVFLFYVVVGFTNHSIQSSNFRFEGIRSMLGLRYCLWKTGMFRTYTVRKTIAQGLLDFALLMANASQLKALLDVSPDNRDMLFIPMLVLIGLSVTMQVLVGVLLLILGSREAKTEEDMHRRGVINNVVTGFILFITVVNVFIAAFGIKFSDDGANNGTNMIP